MIKKLNTFKMTYQSNYYVVTKITLNKFRTLGYYKHLKIKNLQSVSRAILNPDLQSVYLQEMRCQGVLTQFLIQLQSSSIPHLLYQPLEKVTLAFHPPPSLTHTHQLTSHIHPSLIRLQSHRHTTSLLKTKWHFFSFLKQ